MVEGDAFNAREIRDAEDRINGLGYFETATVERAAEGTTPDRALVQVEVEEQPTGSLSLGGAFSSSEGLSAQISLTERNFLGRGQTVTATISASTQFANYEFGFFEPALFDRDLLAGFNVYYRDRNFDEQSFNTSSIGIEPRIGFPLSENGRLTLRYRLSQDDIYDVADDTSRIIEDEEGKLITSALGFTYAYDRRNSVVDPTAGFILTLNQEFAGLGGDTTYSKTRGTARAYTSLFDEDLVLSAELEGGVIVCDDGTRITDRFNTGGDSFRGFARNGLGPRDFCGDDDETACSRAAAATSRSTTRSAATTTPCSGSTRASRSACPRSTASTAASSATSARSGASTTPTAAWARSTTAFHRPLRRSASACSSTRRSRRCASTTRCRSSTRTTT